MPYDNLQSKDIVFSFLTYVIILLFPPIYMVIEHSFMNYSYTANIYIYIYICSICILSSLLVDGQILEVGAYFELIVRLCDAYLRLNAHKMKCCKAENAQYSK